MLMTKEEALSKIATLTGGRAAEELIFGTITSGASNDIEQATKLARSMVTRLGMSDNIRHDGAGDREQPVSGRRRRPGVQLPTPPPRSTRRCWTSSRRPTKRPSAF